MHFVHNSFILATRQFSTRCDDSNTQYYNKLYLFELLICLIREYVHLISLIETKHMAVMQLFESHFR